MARQSGSFPPCQKPHSTFAFNSDTAAETGCSSFADDLGQRLGHLLDPIRQAQPDPHNPAQQEAGAQGKQQGNGVVEGQSGPPFGWVRTARSRGKEQSRTTRPIMATPPRPGAVTAWSSPARTSLGRDGSPRSPDRTPAAPSASAQGTDPPGSCSPPK